MNIYIHSQLAFLPCCAIYAYCTRNAGSDKLIILAYAKAIGTGFSWNKIGELSTSLKSNEGGASSGLEGKSPQGGDISPTFYA